MTAKKTIKKKVGRPSKYREEFCRIAEKVKALGGTDEDLADTIGVCEKTIATWKYEHPEFLHSIRKGQDLHDQDLIEGALRHRARGYSHKETKLNVIDGVLVQTEVVKHYPPDTKAIQLWLNNRDPNRWKDKKEVDVTSGGEPITAITRTVVD